MRGSVVGAGVPDGPFPSPCHSEERSDEESRERNAPRNHTGSFTSFRMTECFVRQFIQKKEMYIPFGIHISFLFFSMLYLLAFFFLLTVAVVTTAAADRVNRAAHRAKLLSSPLGTLVRTGISVFSV